MSSIPLRSIIIRKSEILVISIHGVAIYLVRDVDGKLLLLLLLLVVDVDISTVVVVVMTNLYIHCHLHHRLHFYLHLRLRMTISSISSTNHYIVGYITRRIFIFLLLLLPSTVCWLSLSFSCNGWCGDCCNYWHQQPSSSSLLWFLFLFSTFYSLLCIYHWLYNLILFEIHIYIYLLLLLMLISITNITFCIIPHKKLFLVSIIPPLPLLPPPPPSSSSTFPFSFSNYNP